MRECWPYRIEGEIQQLAPDHEVTKLWLRYVRDQLKSTGLYQELDMLADPDEPRDLFGMLLRAAQQGRGRQQG